MTSGDILNFIRTKKLEPVILQMEASIERIKTHLEALKKTKARNKSFKILHFLMINDEFEFDMYRFYYIEEFKVSLKVLYDKKQRESSGAARYFIRRVRGGDFSDVEEYAATILEKKIIYFHDSSRRFIKEEELPIAFFLKKERKTIGVLVDYIYFNMNNWEVARNRHEVFSIYCIVYTVLYFRYVVFRRQSIHASEMYLECLRKKDPACEDEIRNLIYISSRVLERMLLE